MEALTRVLSKYVRVTKNLNELNAQASELRDNRRTIELDLAALYAHTELPNSIQLKESEMLFSVKRPNQWKKGWTLSKKDLEQYLTEILGEKGKEVMGEIVRRHEPKLVGSDFGFDLKTTGSSS